MVKVPWAIGNVNLHVKKHFAIKYLRTWNWDFHDLREAIVEAYKIEAIGKEKYEIYVSKNGYKKIISCYYDKENKLLCISGSKGGYKK